MTVDELFTRLSFGRLSNLSIGSNGKGKIAEEGQGRIIHYANNALTRIYSRFVLSEKELTIHMMRGLTSYYLLKRFAMFRCPEDPETKDPKYIMDLLDPFEEDVIKVISVFNSKGHELPLNDQEDPRSVFTPSPVLLQVPKVMICEALGVTYQARHRKLEPGVLSQEIILPEVLEEALYSYIAYQVYSDMNGQENSAKGQEHLAHYESVCREVEEKDLVSQTVSTTNTLFEERGFV